MELKVASCSIVILENLYLEEFVKYQLIKGFNHVYIYDHNDPNIENPIDVLKEYVDDGYVTIIPWQGHEVGPAVMEAFQDCWDNYKKEYDYMFFCDIDEYIEFNYCDTIQQYLSMDIFDKQPDIIKINWLCYNDNNQIYYQNLPQQERFKLPCGKNNNPTKFEDNKHIKSIVYTKAKDIDFLHGSPHCPNRFYGKDRNRGIFRYDLTIYNGSGKILNYKNQINESKIDHITYNQVFIKHYRCKTIEEYCKNKIRKLKLNNYKNIDFNLDLFYIYNKETPQKTEYYNNFIKTINEKQFIK